MGMIRWHAWVHSSILCDAGQLRLPLTALCTGFRGSGKFTLCTEPPIWMCLISRTQQAHFLVRRTCTVQVSGKRSEWAVWKCLISRTQAAHFLVASREVDEVA